jgi:hypothetical protein
MLFALISRENLSNRTKIRALEINGLQSKIQLREPDSFADLAALVWWNQNQPGSSIITTDFLTKQRILPPGSVNGLEAQSE